MVDVTLLGTGATMPTPERGVTAAALRCAGRGILFDCGEGTQMALRRWGISPVKLDLIALTHYHGDHCFGLPGLLQTMSCLGREEPLTITGPAGLEEAMEPILRLAEITDYPIRLLPSPRLSMRQLHPAWPREAACAAVPTVHRCPSQGYVFTLDRPPRFLPERARALGVPVSAWRGCVERPEDPVEAEGVPLCREDGAPLLGWDLLGEPRQGLRVVFSGDTCPCAALETAAAGADLLIHEASFAADEHSQRALRYGHSTFRQAAELAARAGVRRLWLAHFSQIIRQPEAYLPLAAAIHPGVRCGEDGMSVTLTFPEEPESA